MNAVKGREAPPQARALDSRTRESWTNTEAGKAGFCLASAERELILSPPPLNNFPG